MRTRTASTVLSLVLLAFGSSAALATRPAPADAAEAPAARIARFDLEDLFGAGATAIPFDDPGAFPYWVLDAAGDRIAVLEEIRSDGSLLLLDAQLLDGNDVKAAIPLDSDAE